ncbi:MAG TPA: endonuclease/exonuclease/phosphatase family protein, partial [Thermomicrobiales bacterium]|nr:endonuclease/exonuclease/phosphatase family protein [Thermomicrobiales bacterium]
RLMMQLWDMPEARLALGAVAIAAWGWLAIALLATHRQAASVGLALGLALDLAIRIAARTVDLPWMPGLAAHATTLALLGLAVAAALTAVEGPTLDAPSGSALPLLAVGPGLALAFMMTGNLGLAQARLDHDFAPAALLLALGVALGLAVTLRLRLDGRAAGLALPAAVVVVGSGGAWFFWQASTGSGVGLVLAVAGSVVMTAGATAGRDDRTTSLLAITAALTGGMLLQVVLLFLFYAGTGAPLFIAVAWGVLALGYLAARAGLPVRDAAPAIAPVGLAVVTLLALVAGWQWIDRAEPAAGAPIPAEPTVMTYNIQNGFSADNHFDLEAQARTIESVHPDVLVLQEIGRGWLVSGGVDEVLWFSQRLGLPYVFASGAGDGLWGNAILSRAPMSNVERHRFSSVANLKRAVAVVQLETEAGPLWVFGTHFDNIKREDAVRYEQVRQLIEVWAGRTPAVLAGDFNTDPGSDVMRELTSNGWRDSGEGLGPGATTTQDERRIDYVMVTSGVQVVQPSIIQRWTSDHLPYVVHLRLAP